MAGNLVIYVPAILTAEDFGLMGEEGIEGFLPGLLSEEAIGTLHPTEFMHVL